MNKIPLVSNSSSKGTALITGASRGIGAVYADRLAKRGHDLILVARSEEPLKALAASLSSASGRQITPIVADLNNETGLVVEAMNGVYGASKAYVLAFSLSLQHELTSKGIRVQAVLPGRTATDGWDVAGFPWQKMPPEIVMPVEDMVDAALVGLDQGELVTIPGL